MQTLVDSIKKQYAGIHKTNSEFLQELCEVVKYYEIYDSFPDSLLTGNQDDYKDCRYGQMWAAKDRDYIPTKEIRNHIKKLLRKQQRFMFGIDPTIQMKPFDKKDKDKAEQKRTVIDRILEMGNFWSLTNKAFADATIGKRVLLMAVAKRGEPMKFRYYTMPEFVYETDRDDCNKLAKVEIAYQDACTLGKSDYEDQRWHKWTYDMREGSCWCKYEVVDGNNVATYLEKEDETGAVIQQTLVQEWNTELDEIPGYIITNEGLTGDIKGCSDIKDLAMMQNSYNRTISDYRDALKFKMFESTTIIDGDSTSIQGLSIAPNAVWDIKTDLASQTDAGTKTAQVVNAASTFNFAGPADSYLTMLKKDMYELMDQPLPEQLVNLPSAKALRYMYYDLMGRCEQKWKDWEPAVKWLIGFITKASLTFNLYPELDTKNSLNVETSILIRHNYPIPEDKDQDVQTALSQVQANVMSHKTFIRTFSDVEDEDGEFEEIIKEMDIINNSSNTGFMSTRNDPLGNEDINTDGDEPEDEALDEEGNPVK